MKVTMSELMELADDLGVGGHSLALVAGLDVCDVPNDPVSVISVLTAQGMGLQDIEELIMVVGDV